MQIPESLLTREEKAQLMLRALFEQAGYTRYAMSRFEPYDLYVENKDFLGNDRIITFTDVSGKLMALKPDVTLSIVRRASFLPGDFSRVYYTENVYRARPGDGAFREILQAGVECIGDLGMDDVCDVLLLAKSALNALHPDNLLMVSHPGFVSGMMQAAGVQSRMVALLLQAVQDKNMPQLTALCSENGLGTDACQLLRSLIEVYGPLDASLLQLQSLCRNDAMRSACTELSQVGEALKKVGAEESIRIDFSVMGNMQYYDGLVFTGYINGLPGAILSGGQYGGLLQKMGRPATAIGFAVYLNEVEYLP